MDISARSFEDQDGLSWSAERIGRTSGIVAPNESVPSVPGPADIIRFVCTSDPDEQDRETTMEAGILAGSSDSDLIDTLKLARKVPRPKSF